MIVLIWIEGRGRDHSVDVAILGEFICEYLLLNFRMCKYFVLNDFKCCDWSVGWVKLKFFKWMVGWGG